MDSARLSDRLLLEHVEWVGALVRQLAGEQGREDLVQETFLAALRRPPSHAGNLRGYLARIARNVVRMDHRREVRRRSRESASPPVGAASEAAALVERAELQRRVVQAVLQLKEPDRSIVLERFFEARAPRDIARRRKLPEGTVRSRLSRALERVRRELDAGHGGDRDAWRATVLAGGLGARPSRDATIARAQEVSSATTVLGVLGSALAAGVLLMTTPTKILASLAVAAAVAVGTHRWWDGPEPATPLPIEGGEREEAPPEPSTMPSLEVVREEPSTRTSVSSSGPTHDTEPAAAGVLHGHLEGLLTHAPWTTPLRIQVDRGSEAREVPVSLDGTFSCDLSTWTEVESVQIEADDPRYHLVDRRYPFDPSLPLVVDVAAVATVGGTVVDEGFRPIGGALVSSFAFDPSTERADRGASVQSDEGGRWSLRAGADQLVNAGRVLLVATPRTGEGSQDDELLCAHRFARLSLGDVVEVDPLVLSDGHEVTGRVVWPDGAPVPDVTMDIVTIQDEEQLELETDEESFTWNGHRVIWKRERETRTDLDGRFVFTGLPESACRMGVDWWDGGLVHLRHLERTVAPPERDLRVVLDAARLHLSIWIDGELAPRSTVRLTQRLGGGVMSRTSSIVGGRVELLLVPNSTYEIGVRSDGYREESSELITGSSGGEDRREVHLRPELPRVLRLHVRGDADVPERLHFEFHSEDGDRERLTRESIDGAFVFEGFPAGRQRLRVSTDDPLGTGEAPFLMTAEAEWELPEQGEIEHEITLRSGGRIALHVRDSDGAYLDAECRVLRGSTSPPLHFLRGTLQGYISSNHVIDGGENLTRPLTPGGYQLEFRREGHPPIAHDVVVVAGETVELWVELE